MSSCGPDGQHRAPSPADGPTACPCGRVSRHPAPAKEASPVIVNRTKVGIRYAGAPLLTAECVLCGHRAAFLDPGERAAVAHDCPRGIAGPTWTLLQRPAGALVVDERTAAGRAIADEAAA